jgi:hypothetical protein
VKPGHNIKQLYHTRSLTCVVHRCAVLCHAGLYIAVLCKHHKTGHSRTDWRSCRVTSTLHLRTLAFQHAQHMVSAGNAPTYASYLPGSSLLQLPHSPCPTSMTHCQPQRIPTSPNDTKP